MQSPPVPKTTPFTRTSGLPDFKIAKIESEAILFETTGSQEEKKDNIKMIWITSGKGALYIDLIKHEFTGNQFYFIKPGNFFAFEKRSSAEGFIISFSDLFLRFEDQEFDPDYHQTLDKLFAANLSLNLCNDVIPDLKLVINRITNEYNNLYRFRKSMLQRLFRILIIYLSRELEDTTPTILLASGTSLTCRFLSLLEQKFKSTKMVADYAAHLYVTPNYLNEIIKKSTGHSAGFHIRHRIILEAKRQAVYYDLSMKEIAYDLGFYDMAHFSKFFKNASGLNFSDFKRLHSRGTVIKHY